MSNLDDVTAIFDDQVRCRWYDYCRNHADGYIHLNISQLPFTRTDARNETTPVCEPCATILDLPLTRWEH